MRKTMTHDNGLEMASHKLFTEQTAMYQELSRLMVQLAGTEEKIEALVDLLRPLDLMIYLRASVPTLIDRISRRGRDYERTIAPEYLQSLNDLYESWISDFVLCPVLTIPADDLDFVAHSGHLRLIVSKIEEKLTGNEEVVFEPDEVARAAHD